MPKIISAGATITWKPWKKNISYARAMNSDGKNSILRRRPPNDAAGTRQLVLV